MTVAQRSSAHRMIAAKGQTVTLTRRSSGAYDPATGEAAVTTTTQTGKGVILPFGAGIRNMPGSTVTADDRQCLLSGLKTDGTALTEPEVSDTLTDANADVWTIAEVAPLSPAGLDIIYELKITGAG